MLHVVKHINVMWNDYWKLLPIEFCVNFLKKVYDFQIGFFHLLQEKIWPWIGEKKIHLASGNDTLYQYHLRKVMEICFIRRYSSIAFEKLSPEIMLSMIHVLSRLWTLILMFKMMLSPKKKPCSNHIVHLSTKFCVCMTGRPACFLQEFQSPVFEI